ncbi:MAG: nucleosidase, partial [Propionibacterium sp.]|nr:nucleosidase [Propionibacterium sp.]
RLVDMEGFAIAHACRELGVELVMIKHVSDPADESSLAWKDVVDLSARALAEAYEAIRR